MSIHVLRLQAVVVLKIDHDSGLSNIKIKKVLSNLLVPF